MPRFNAWKQSSNNGRSNYNKSDEMNNHRDHRDHRERTPRVQRPPYQKVVWNSPPKSVRPTSPPVIRKIVRIPQQPKKLTVQHNISDVTITSTPRSNTIHNCQYTDSGTTDATMYSLWGVSRPPSRMIVEINPKFIHFDRNFDVSGALESLEEDDEGYVMFKDAYEKVYLPAGIEPMEYWLSPSIDSFISFLSDTNNKIKKTTLACLVMPRLGMPHSIMC